jgi:hypothetical protein
MIALPANVAAKATRRRRTGEVSEDMALLQNKDGAAGRKLCANRSQFLKCFVESMVCFLRT